MTLDNHDIECIEFGILSPEEIRAFSVCEVTNSKLEGNGSVYDERMGYIIDITDQCVTCGLKEDCWGHFGYINLSEPVLHPMYYKMISLFL